MATKETFANARARIHTALRQQHGWKTSDAGLKRLWADSPKGYRVWFRTQAVYLGEHSIFADIRGVNVEIFIRDLDKLYEARTRGEAESEAAESKAVQEWKDNQW